MKRVLIADDHEITRRGIRELLQEAYPGLEVVEAGDGDAVLAQLLQGEWDLLLLDVLMPGPEVMDLVAEIRADLPTVPVLMLTAATELEYVFQLLGAGANGLIHKHRAATELLGAIEQVRREGRYLHPENAAEVAARLAAPAAPVLHERLSKRELEIFCAIAAGRSVKAIATDLSLSDKTVATYIARIRGKTELQSYVDMARYAVHHKLVD
ncbi:MAG: response regulator transcription factor [Myxococcales bacterium]|nr:response regulator transcription factor [Myxococcales bacterium]